MKLGSVYRADRAQSNGSAMRSLTNFHFELAVPVFTYGGLGSLVLSISQVDRESEHLNRHDER